MNGHLFGPAIATRRTLTRNIAWNFFGLTAPLLAALVAVPRLLAGLGTERFALLALAWALLGYFTLFDVGLGRALTQSVSVRLGAGGVEEVPKVVWSSLLLLLVVGALGAACLDAVRAPALAAMKSIPPDLRPEAMTCYRLLAATVPILTLTAGIRGILEAYQEFALLSTVRVAAGILMFAAPLPLMTGPRPLLATVVILCVLRLSMLVVFAAYCIRLSPELWRRRTVATAAAIQVLRLGGWMTVSNIVSPLMTYLDRFIIGAILSVSAVTFYATSQEIATRLILVPSAIVGVLFPAFGRTLTVDQPKARNMYRLSMTTTIAFLFPVALLLILFSRELLTFWLGSSFAAQSCRSFQILVLGVLITGPAMVAFALLQAAGRPDLTAIFHLAELPVYLAGAFCLIKLFGLTGAAVASVGRIALDALLLFWAAKRVAGVSRGVAAQAALAVVLAAGAVSLDYLNAGLVMKCLSLAVLTVPAAHFGRLVLRQRTAEAAAGRAVPCYEPL